VQKNAVAVAYCKRGKGEMRLNGAPLELVQPDTLRWKVMEPVLLLGKQRFSNVDIRIRVKGGGRISQIYAIRQSIAKALVAFYQKCEWPAGWVGRRSCCAQRAPLSNGLSGWVLMSRLAACSSPLLWCRRGRAEQERDQEHPADVRPDAACGGPPPLRAQEVWRPGCTRALPEELPLIIYPVPSAAPVNVAEKSRPNAAYLSEVCRNERNYKRAPERDRGGPCHWQRRALIWPPP